MSRFSGQAAHIENSKTALLNTQAAYLRYIVYGSDSFAQRAREQLAEAKKQFELCLPMVASPENRQKMSGCIKQLEAILPVLQKCIDDQKKSIRLLAQADEARVGLTKAFDAMEAMIREVMLTQGVDATSIDNQTKVLELRIEFNRLRTELRSLSLRSTQEELNSVSTALKNMRDAMAEQANRFRTPSNKAAMAAIIREMDKYLPSAQASIEFTHQMGVDLRSLAVLFRNVDQSATELSTFGVSQVQESNRDANFVILGFCGAALLCGIFITVFLTRNVNAQLGKDPGQLSVIAHRVVGGDYNVDDGGKKQGVYGAIVKMVGALERNIKKAELESKNAQEATVKAEEAMKKAEAAGQEAKAKAEALLNVAGRLEEVGSVVSSASTQLSAQIEQSDRGAGEAAQRLSEAATAMNEMNATVQEVARNASAASAASADTKDKATAGAQVVERSLRRIESVHQVSLELKDDMTQLNEHAQDITRIMGVISDIADQTNLLALNAAIEAARAGEAGRGFAVVADEVRKLAEKTMASTNDVGNAIKAIQESTAKSTASVDNAVAQIEEATGLANESGRALEEIVTTAETTADQVNAIATASEEQSAASEEINHSILLCNDMSRQIADAMAEAAKAVSGLAREAQELSELIHEMKEG
ncbi:methyl-accepting chemotaxis protein [uncultured Desulfovibrio sp.]|uniref:methyl-accepting chemotaxis protein n=2 Tax=uncultured Desulfovibrio sp. TaxID=167968 RepID=UPI0026DB441E|nr:methyl-accepting chemotaxis protein [uncultured Desulfovibrio sp.]